MRQIEAAFRATRWAKARCRSDADFNEFKRDVDIAGPIFRRVLLARTVDYEVGGLVPDLRGIPLRDVTPRRRRRRTLRLLTDRELIDHLLDAASNPPQKEWEADYDEAEREERQKERNAEIRKLLGQPREALLMPDDAEGEGEQEPDAQEPVVAEGGDGQKPPPVTEDAVTEDPDEPNKEEGTPG